MNLTGPPSQEVRRLFGSIASTYDRANDAMTLGLARRWRQKLVEQSGAAPGMRVLDCATGTGDLALAFKVAVGRDGVVIGTDFCQEMLAAAPGKARRRHLDVQFEEADVLDLPYPDNHFDISSIAYGIRNVADPQMALKEMARVIRPGGKVMVLETGDQPAPWMAAALRFHFSFVVPLVGGLISGKRSAYEYLNRTSRAFPSRDEFTQLMRQTEMFSDVGFTPLLGGASFIYWGQKR